MQDVSVQRILCEKIGQTIGLRETVKYEMIYGFHREYFSFGIGVSE